MTLTDQPFTGFDKADSSPQKHHPHRWRLNRAGLVDIWYYYNTEFDVAGGRLILRGTNGSGKSRALELLLPFVLDADRRRMDATGAGKVSLIELMKAGLAGRTTRVGYLWLELARTVDPADAADADLHAAGATKHHLTIGAQIRFSRSTGEAKVHYFTTDLRVGFDLELLSSARETLPRERLADLIGADRITTSPETHRGRVRAAVFTLTGDSGADRYAGLLQLMHTLRSPDVGNRIEEGRLPQILADALPPLNEVALSTAGEQLDGLSETRAAQGRLEAAQAQVNAFLHTYRRYAATVVAESVDTADAVATAAEAAVKDARERAREQAQFETERGAKKARMGELVETLTELEATISGIKQSPAYADARDLDERVAKVKALGSATDIALSAAEMARTAERREVDAADRAADSVVQASVRAAAALETARTKVEAAGGFGSLPATVAAAAVPGSALVETIRLARHGDLSAFPRRAPARLGVTPDDLGSAGAQVNLVEAGVRERGRQAEGRQQTARSLEVQRRKVDDIESRAEEADARAREAEGTRAERRSDLDEAAIAYTGQWRAWVVADATVAAYGGQADLTDTAVHAVLQDWSGLLDELGVDDLADLDRVAAALEARASERHIRRVAELESAGLVAAEVRVGLASERTQLESAVDPRPATPSWLRQAADDVVPLWRAIDFGEGLTDHERAGLEGALLASGLLLSTVHAEGTLRAQDGQLLVTPTGPVAEHPVTGKLVADVASPVPSAVIEGVLSRIGCGPRRRGRDDPSADGGIWVDADGSWGSGPMTGRHVPVTARHIGAAARDDARRARLAAIGVELAELARAEQVRAVARAEAIDAMAHLQEVTRAAPRTQAIASARVRAADAVSRAEKERSSARAAAALATQTRTAWARANEEHRGICSEFGLPYAVDKLDQVRHAIAGAGSACQGSTEQLAHLGRLLEAHQRAVGQAGERATERQQAEARASAEWTVWHREASELESVRANIGQAAAAARAELRSCQNSQRRLSVELEQVRADESRLGQQVGAAQVESRNAAVRATSTQGELVDAVDRLRRRVALPGIAAAAYEKVPEPVKFPEVTPTAVRKAVARMTAGLLSHGQALDDNVLIRPQQTLERELSGTYDVIAEVRDGVRLVELSDATGRRTVAQAAAELARTVAEGRSALTDRERRVFTEFILGGVAEELRRRLGQAEKLVEAMNASLTTIRTSHGIGVKLRWKVADNSDPTVGRIKVLLATAGAVRSVEQTAELTELLKARVDEAFALDESAGYATHLRDALDYRSWHQVEVLILGPEPGKERLISRKARLSQGETRFVSYLTLFAAIDAYLSGLPDTSRALRLLLLDDAFAKVDDRTIGELMGLLVRLDVDFVMTGHALWGTYPQVPALDCYEVRRVEGSEAVTTHTHWDGHSRHLRAAR